MVKVFTLNIKELGDPVENPELMEILPTQRREKIMKCKQAKGRCQSLGAGLLLQHVVTIYGKDASEIFINSNGKPEIEGLYFNLSHSHDMAVCAVSDAPVGCDIEKIEKTSLRIAQRYFCESERRFLELLNDEEKTEEFIRLWTIKESYLKMTGEGMKIPLGQVEIILGTPIQIYRNGILETCHIKEYEIPGYKLTVCARENEFEEKNEAIFIDMEPTTRPEEDVVYLG